MDTGTLLKPTERDFLIEVVQRSLFIDSHADFVQWLQRDVRPFIPHDALVAVWGKFNGDRLKYDISSSIPGLTTKQIVGSSDCDETMKELYRRWLTFDEHWFAVRDFHEIKVGDVFESACMMRMDLMRHVIVHGVRDKRGKIDCLYLFFLNDYSKLEKIDDRLLNLMLPYIDFALRRVECLEPANDQERYTESGVFAILSERELEILNWLELGKTNQEIGLILGISANTVKNHLKRIFKKLDVTNRAQAVGKYTLLFKK